MEKYTEAVSCEKPSILSLESSVTTVFSPDDYWNRKFEFFENKNRIVGLKAYVEKRIAKNPKRKKAYKRVSKVLRKTGSNKWKSPSYDKWVVLKEFWEQATDGGFDISAPLLIANHRVVNEGSLDRLELIGERHTRDNVLRIVETLPAVLGYSLDRTKSIYKELDSRHQSEQTNRIVETLPAVLGYSLGRTRSIYKELDSRHQPEQTNRIVETLPAVLSCSLDRTKRVYTEMSKKVSNGQDYIGDFPIILYFSPEFVKVNSLETIVAAANRVEDYLKKRRFPHEMVLADGGIEIVSDMAEFRKYASGRGNGGLFNRG